MEMCVTLDLMYKLEAYDIFVPLKIKHDKQNYEKLKSTTKTSLTPGYNHNNENKELDFISLYKKHIKFLLNEKNAYGNQIKKLYVTVKWLFHSNS